ncbi:hypothetical protein Clacol_007154 [Clathrus columnatus]|uniref:Aminoglycoside phosphotransferase domain-containing protein n=1 Tax=Clathrus columnatus TaxID=1419009 RepID=A0AAV5AIG5_9AGAM|nr:hypothetical protein Clacol_007154 [Clathrus columnatus]
MMFRKLLPMFKAQDRLLYGETASRVLYRITPRLAIKINGYGLFTEANTLKFIRNSTSIPVPRVLDAWMEAEHSITLLEWIPDCDTLRDCWLRLSQDRKDSIADQVKGYVDQLRSICRPPKYQTRIEPVDGSSFFHDCVFGKPHEPFSSEEEFNKLLISRVGRYAALAESANAQKEWIQNNM